MKGVHRPIYRLCQGAGTGSNSAAVQTAFTSYQLGKSSVSIAQQLTSMAALSSNPYPNCYVDHKLCTQQPSDLPENQLQRVFRFIVQAQIGKDSIALDINRLRKSKIIDQLLRLQQMDKFVVKAARIIIDDEIGDTLDEDGQKRLENNMMEVEKLLGAGFNLEIAYMISNKNVGNKNWPEMLRHKNKAIHANIVEKQSTPETLQHFIFDHGYRLQHIFLSPYKDGTSVGLLSEATNFNLTQMINVFSIINFEGKIVLEDNEHFNANVQVLDQMFRKGGFAKNKLGDSDWPMWHLLL